MKRAAIVAALLAVAASARAEEPRHWSVEAGAGVMVLGGENATGGIAPTVSARYGWPLGESARVVLGGSASVFGFGGDPHWIGFLVGPDAGIEARGGAFSGGLSLGIDYGRVPACNDWSEAAICMRFWGLYPRVGLYGAYALGESAAIVAGVSARYINTLAWSGVGWEPSVAGRVSF